MHLAETELLGTLSKDEQHGVNDVGFAAAVWTHHRGEPLPRVLVRWATQTHCNPARTILRTTHKHYTFCVCGICARLVRQGRLSQHPASKSAVFAPNALHPAAHGNKTNT